MCPPMKQANYGTGMEPGLWLFEEFEFLPGVLGKAYVKYEVNSQRVPKCDRNFGDVGRPYEIELSNPEIPWLEIFDDAGESIPLNADDMCAAQKMVLAAWREASEHVVDFEMGLL